MQALKPLTESTARFGAMPGTELLKASDVASPAWWARVTASGTPLVERIAPDRCRVSFLWRDPSGDDKSSDIRRVYADVNSVTNHHSFEPQSLARLAGTDLWHWQVELPSDWRGSYAFIPVTAEQLPPHPQGDHEAQRLQQRHWWMSIADRAVADPLNLRAAIVAGWGVMSAAHLPDAPDQSAWQAFDMGKARHEASRLHEITWQGHHVWIYETGPGGAARPLVLLLDGQHWGRNIPIFSALDEATARGILPPSAYVLIDAIDGPSRERDLACNVQFWQGVQDELLPRVTAIAPHSLDADCTVVAGQSLGGLAAMYAGLHWPQRFGRVLSQSGSFWWPQVELLFPPPGEAHVRRPGARGWLAGQVEAGTLPPSRLQIWQEVGSREDVMVDVNDSLHEALRAAQHAVRYRIFEGGHDRVCWRGGLIDGLAHLLAPFKP